VNSLVFRGGSPPYYVIVYIRFNFNATPYFQVNFYIIPGVSSCLLAEEYSIIGEIIAHGIALYAAIASLCFILSSF